MFGTLLKVLALLFVFLLVYPLAYTLYVMLHPPVINAELVIKGGKVYATIPATKLKGKYINMTIVLHGEPGPFSEAAFMALAEPEGEVIKYKDYRTIRVGKFANETLYVDVTKYVKPAGFAVYPVWKGEVYVGKKSYKLEELGKLERTGEPEWRITSVKARVKGDVIARAKIAGAVEQAVMRSAALLMANKTSLVKHLPAVVGGAVANVTKKSVTVSVEFTAAAETAVLTDYAGRTWKLITLVTVNATVKVVFKNGNHTAQLASLETSVSQMLRSTFPVPDRDSITLAVVYGDNPYGDQDVIIVHAKFNPTPIPP